MSAGHIRRRGANSWELKFDAGTDPLTGQRQTKYFSFRGTKRKAEKKLAELITAVERGDYVDPSKVTLNEFLDRWQRDWAANNVSPKTYERYGELLRCHVRPHIGAAKVQKLRPIHFAELYAKLIREGRIVRQPAPERGATLAERSAPLSPRTVGHVHRLLHRALGHAVQWGLIGTNPVDNVDPPKVEAVEIEILTENQAREVLQKMRGRSLYPIVLLALATGMRRGELLALRWKDVDLDNAKLRVEQSLEQTKPDKSQDQAETGLRFKSPKTKHGRRLITLPASAVAELRALRERRQRIVAGVPDGAPVDLALVRLPEDALVFPNWDGGPRNPNSVTTEWRKVVARLKLPRVSLHALRHTHASQLIASGLDVLTVSRRLGHSSPTITLGVYGHLFANTDDRAAAVVDAAFRRALTE